LKSRKTRIVGKIGKVGKVSKIKKQEAKMVEGQNARHNNVNKQFATFLQQIQISATNAQVANTTQPQVIARNIFPASTDINCPT